MSSASTFSKLEDCVCELVWWCVPDMLLTDKSLDDLRRTSRRGGDLGSSRDKKNH